MKRLMVMPLMVLPLVAADRDDDRYWRYEENETINKTFKVATGDNAAKLLVDNVNGYIHVTGTTGSEIVVKVDKQIRAESRGALSDAKKEVELDMTQQGDTVKLYVDGPFRSHNGFNYRGDDYYGYRVIFDFEIQVPAGAQLDLGTLNSTIEVKDSRGDFHVHTLNGGINMEEIGGSGSAKTLNGGMKITFARNPVHESSFETLNGSIDLYFQPNLDADLTIHTLHGGVYSDFDVTTVPTVVKGEVSGGGRYIYRTGGDMKVRAGKGGTGMSLHTLNGSIRLHSKAI